MNYFVKTVGVFWKPMNPGSNLNIGGVVLIPDSSVNYEAKPELLVRIELQVAAQNPHEASRNALDVLEAARAVALLVFNSTFDYSVNLKVQGTHSAYGTGTVEGPPVNAQDITNVGTVNSRLSASSAADALRLSLALRWYQRGIASHDTNDRFVSLWIGFEMLTRSTGYKVNNAVNAFVKFYPSADRSKVDGVIRTIYQARKEIFHEGNLYHSDIGVRTEELLQIYGDLLGNEIGAPGNNRSAKLFGL